MNGYKLLAIDSSVEARAFQHMSVTPDMAATLLMKRNEERLAQLNSLRETAILERDSNWMNDWYKHTHTQVIKNVGVISINDELTHETEWYGLSYKMITSALNEMEEDAEVDAIVLDINSPGGEISGLLELAQAVKDSPKPVYGYAEGLTASAALLLISCCKEVYSTSSTTIGSVGVMAIAYNYDEAYKNAGIKQKVFRASDSPKKNLDPFGEEGASEVQKSVDESMKLFIGMLADNRGVAPDDAVKKFGKGLTFHADEALEKGLVDEIVENFDDCMDKIMPSLQAGGGGVQMAQNTEMTIDALKAQYPEIAKAIAEEGRVAGFADGKKEGAGEERKRIVALEELRGVRCSEEIIKDAIANGDSAEKASMAILKEQQKNPAPAPANVGASLKELEEESASDTINPLAPNQKSKEENGIDDAVAKAKAAIEKTRKSQKA